MERVMQWLEDLDDLVAMVGRLSERIRKAAYSLLLTGFVLTVQIGGVFLALAHPPLALATALMLAVLLLYRSATSPRLEIA